MGETPPLGTGDFLTDRIMAIREFHQLAETQTWVKKLQTKIRKWQVAISRPNLRNSACIAGIIIILILVNYLIPLAAISENDPLVSYFTTLWQVQTAIAGVALPFLLFMIEFSKEQAYATLRSSEVLIHNTLIFPVTAYSLGVTFKIGIDTFWKPNWNIYYIDFFLFGLSVFGTLHAYTTAMALMFNRSKMKEEAERLLILRVSSDLDRTIDIRIGRHIVETEIKEWPLVYSPFSITDETEYLSLEVEGEGEIVDIDFERFRYFVDSLRRRPAISSVTMNPRLTVASPMEVHKERTKPDIYLFKTIGDQISLQDRSVLFLKKDIFGVVTSEDSIEFKKIFAVVPNDRSEVDRIRYELTMLRNGMIDAIRSGHADVVLEGMKTYKKLAELFLDKLRPYGGRYPREEVLAEFIEGWSEVQWIRDDYKEILVEAIRNETGAMFSNLFYFTRSIAELALKDGNYYLFHHLTYWVPGFVYRQSRKLRDEELRSFVIDRCWRYLREFSDYYVGHYLDEAAGEEKIASVREISTGIILIFNDLLRVTFDQKDLETFKIFRRGLLRSFEYPAMKVEQDAEERYEWQMERPDLGAEERSRIERKLHKAKASSELIEMVTHRRQQLLFGLEAWILRCFFGDIINANEFKKWHDVTGGFGNLDESLSILIGCLKKETGDLFRWTWWVLEEHEDLVAVRIDFDASLRYLYCLHAIETLKSMSAESRRAIQLSISREDKFILNQLVETIKEIGSNSERWKELVGEVGMRALPDLQWLINESSQKIKEEEIVQLIVTPIDPSQIIAFETALLISWEEHATVRNIINQYGNYNFGGSAPEDLGFYGMNSLLEKNLFLEGPSIVEDLGKQIGQVTARHEDRTIMPKIIDGMKSFVSEPITKDEILSHVNLMLTTIQEEKLSPVILILDSWESERAIETAESFQSGPKGTPSWLLGSYREVPVLRIYAGLRNTVAVADLKSLGTLKQYKPKLVVSGEELLGNNFSFLLRPIDETYAMELIVENPDLKKDAQSNEVLDDQKAIRQLRQKVHLRLLQQFEFLKQYPDAGLKVVIARH